MTPQNPEELSVWLAVQKLVRSVVDHISASIDYALRRGSESSSDPSLSWLAEVMRHTPPPEHAMPYGAYMQTVRELMQHADALKAVLPRRLHSTAARVQLHHARQVQARRVSAVDAARLACMVRTYGLDAVLDAARSEHERLAEASR